MLDNRKRFYINTLRAADCLVVCVAYFWAMGLFVGDKLVAFLGGRACLDTALFSAAGVALTLLVLQHVISFEYHYTIKEQQRYIPGLKHQLRSLLWVLGVDCGILLATHLNFWIAGVDLRFYLAYLGASLGLNAVLRILMHGLITRWAARNANRVNIVLIGTNHRAVQFYDEIRSTAFLGYSVVGFIDDADFSGKNLPMLGKLDQLAEILRKNIVDSVIVCLPVRSYYDRIAQFVSVAETQGVSLQYLSNLFEPKISKYKPSQYGPLSFILLHSAPLQDWKLATKRIFDALFSLAALIALSPLLLGIAALIKRHDGGPVLFFQRRVGFNKREFNVWKFRTMVVNAQELMPELEKHNEMVGAGFKIANDPRVTSIGRVLRKYALDELPQFVNVLMGDMSVVGPRPLSMRDYSLLSEDRQRRRFSMRPGVTCIWQTHVDRNRLTFAEWIDMDMEYIEKWSLGLDAKLIWATIGVVLRGRGV